MEVVLTFRPTLRSYFDNRVIAHADVCIKSEDYSVLESFAPTKTGYKQAERFMRLLERGYSPDAAHWLSRYSQPTKQDFELEFDASAHDKLTDEIPSVIPEGYSIEEFSIDELATSELRSIIMSWYRDGEEALFIAAEEYSVNYNELRSYVHGFVQHEDESADNWTSHHHSAVVTY